MKPATTRTLLWLLAALAAAALALGVLEAGRRDDPAPALIATILAEAALGVAGHLAFATRNGAPAAHTRARWRTLDATRTLAALLVFGFLAALLVAAFSGVALSDPWLTLALGAPIGAALLCALGAILERESFERVEPSAQRARKVYETRTGAVLLEEHDGRKEVVLTGRGGRRDVDAVEREVDRRGWREGETPESADLTEALQRWGVLKGNTE